MSAQDEGHPSAPTGPADSRTPSSSAQDAKPNGVAASNKDTRQNVNASKPPSKVPKWIKDNLTSGRSLRILARCWVATWANFLLMIPGPSLRVLGQAAFFGCMLSLMIPPSMPFFLFLLAFGMLAIGALLGWAWGCAAMAAANRARSQPLLQSAIQRVQSGAGSSTNPEAYVTTSVFRGSYLDVRSTAVFGVFLMLGVYVVAVLQVKRPKLKIGSIFMLIVLDIMCSYGPLFPSTRYTLGEIFMIPIGCSLAICLASQVLIFPETLAYAWQLRFVSMLATTRDLVRLHSDALADASHHHDSSTSPSTQAHLDQPSNDLLKQSLKAEDEAAKTASTLLTNIKANRAIIAEQIEDINGLTSFLGMEFYRSYFSAHDMKAVFRKTRSVNLQLTLLNTFWRLVHREIGLADPSTFDEGWDPSKAEEGYHVDGEHGAEALPTKKHLTPIRLHETSTIHRVRRDIFASEAQQQVTMSRMLHILHNIAATSLDAAADSIEAVQAYFEANLAWKQKCPIDQVLRQLHETKTNLESARQALLNDKRLELLHPYAEHFRALHPDLDLEKHFLQTKESIRSFRAGVRPLHVCLVFITNLLDALDTVSQLHDEMLTIADRSGNKKRIWGPKHLSRLVGVLSSDKRGSSDGLDRFGPGDGQFEREDAIDSSFRNDRAHTAAWSDSSETQTVADHLEGESDDDSDGDSRQSPSSRPSRPVDEEKGSAGARGRAEKGSKKSKHDRKDRYYARDPDALPPTSVLHRVGRGVAATYSFVTGPTGIYALRMCIATFAVWITSVLPHSAYFVYQHRGIWALIMAQTAAALSGGELVFTFAMRLIGTVVGLLYGAVLWYISTGNGRGNAYGLAATTAVGFIPLVFLRVWAPKMLLLPAIMLNVSVVLICGYSWIDTHLQVLANSGIGIEVAWKRTLLVVIGMFVALVVMVFPRPVSSRLLLRKNMAKTTRQLNDLFVDVMQAWIERNRIQEQEAERAGFQNQIGTNDDKTQQHGDTAGKFWQEREPLIRARFMAISANVASYPMQIGLATMDFHIRGRWPAERYAEIAAVHATILESLGAIVSSVRAFDGLTTLSSEEDMVKGRHVSEVDSSKMDWQSLLSTSTSLLDPQYLSEICMIFDLLSKALRNGERLNHASFSLLENYFKYANRNRHIDAFLRRKRAEGLKQAETSPGTTEGVDVLSWGVLRDPMYLRYTTARMAAITLATELDKFKAIVQDLVGENSLIGFDTLKERHDERMYRAQAAADSS